MLTDLVRVSWFCRTAVCSTVGIFVTFWRNLNKYSVRQLFLIIASVFCSLCLISYFILSCDFHLFFPPFHSPFISLFVSLCVFLHPPPPLPMDMQEFSTTTTAVLLLLCLQKQQTVIRCSVFVGVLFPFQKPILWEYITRNAGWHSA